MINLLPDENKLQIRAGRANVILVNYLIILGFAIGFLVLACGTIYLILLNVKTSNEKNTSEMNSKITPYSQIKTRADAMTNSINTAKTVLDQQVSYSQIITGIAAALPTDVILDSLSLSSTSLGTPVTLQLHAKTSDNESKLQSNFNSSLFSSPSIISSTADSNGPTGYKWKITMSIVINRGAAQ